MIGCVATFVAMAVIVGPLDEARAQRGRPAARASITQLAWLAGTWTGNDGPVAFQERWTTPAGGAMLAVSRTVKGDRMVAFEFLRIVERAVSYTHLTLPTSDLV